MIEWRKDEYDCWHATAASLDPHDHKRSGFYEIIIQRRPHYCDRGDWQIYLESHGKTSIDGADGFPRYFFGTEEEVKRQMETWVSRRAECREAEKS